MNILYYISGYDGCGYYRVQLPAKYLNKRSDVYAKISSIYNKDDIKQADLVVIQKQTNQNALQFVKYARELGKKVISECDDCYFSIPISNPAYKYYKDRGQDLINFYNLSDAMTVTTPHLKNFMVLRLTVT